MTLVLLIFLTAPGTTEIINVTARSPSSLAVQWSKPPGGLKGYNVTLEGEDGDHPAEQRDENTTSATFNGLRAGTEYTVLVITLSGDQQSETAEKKCYTGTYKQQ